MFVPVLIPFHPNRASELNRFLLLFGQGQGPYAKQLKKIEEDIDAARKRVEEKLGKLFFSSLLIFPALAVPVAEPVYPGVKESETGLAPPNLWDFAADKHRMSQDHPLQVARCTKIIRAPVLSQEEFVRYFPIRHLHVRFRTQNINKDIDRLLDAPLGLRLANYPMPTRWTSMSSTSDSLRNLLSV
jgi:hypothetical protein